MNVISRVREQRRQLKAEAKRLERAQRRAARREGAMLNGDGHSTTADVPERVYGAAREEQSASVAESVR